MKNNVYIGIDPGVNGGIAAITEDGVYATKMPQTIELVWEWIRDAVQCGHGEPFVAIEQVGGFVGGAGNTGSSMFTFGQSAGWLQMAVVASGVPATNRRMVIPRTWQKALGIEVRRSHKEGRKKVYDETPPQFKRRLKELAASLFPDKTATLASADALLIAYYLKQQIEAPTPVASRTSRRKSRAAEVSQVTTGLFDGESKDGRGGQAAGQESGEGRLLPAAAPGGGERPEGAGDY
jgi:hypothetical protein